MIQKEEKTPNQPLFVDKGGGHCESGEGLWLQGEVASQTHSSRDAEPHPVISLNKKKKKTWNISKAAQTRHKYKSFHH